MVLSSGIKSFFSCLIFFSILAGFGVNFTEGVSGLYRISDTISTSWPGPAAARHTIRFTVASPVPSLGKIIITPQAGVFFIPPDLNYANLRFFINESEQSLGDLPGEGTSGVEVVSGINGIITITLATDLTIATESVVIIEVGVGAHQITNPVLTDSYRIRIQTFDDLDNLLDIGTAVIAIIDPVNVGAGVEFEEPQLETLPASVLDQNSAILHGILFNLGPAATVDTFFQYRVKDAEIWTETPRVIRDVPVIFSRIVPGLQADTIYEFRAALDWMDEGEAVQVFGEILEFSTHEAEEPGPEPGPPPGPPPGPGPGPPSEPTDPPLVPPPYVIFEGWAFPNVSVILLKDNQGFATTTANAQAEFSFKINNPLDGVFSFILRARDNQGRSSIDIPFTIEADPEKVVKISNIIFAPTIELSKNAVEQGDTLEIFGQTAPNGFLDIRFIDSQGGEFSRSAVADAAGSWRLILDTINIKEDRYRVRARVRISNENSGFSRVLNFSIGDVCGIADLNCDGKVDLIDFSILMFYWGTTDPRADINGDGKVDIVDFSIMMAYWTG